MALPLVTGIAVVAMLLVVRQFARVRALRGRAQFVWLMFLPTLIGGFLILGVGVEMLVTAPVGGVVMMLTGSIYVAALIGFLTGSTRAVAASTDAQAMVEPLEDVTRMLAGLVLIGGLAALVGLVVWAASQAAR